MNFPIFASFIVLAIWMAYEIQKTNKVSRKKEESFWQEEAKANKTRRKSLENLPYITIPFDTLPMKLLAEDETIHSYHETLRDLSDSPIVNLTGTTNTELKLLYGAPNITLLTRYDQSYTTLARTLYQWGNALYERGFHKEAKSILEFALSTYTDVSGTYRLLISIYQEEGTPDRIKDMIPIAEQIHSAMQKTILRILKEAMV